MKNQPADRPAYMAHCNHCGSCLNSCPLRLHDLKAEQGANVATNFQQTYIGHEMNARKGWSTSAHWKQNSAPKMNRGNTAESADGNQSDLGCNFVRRVHTDARSENQQRHTNKSLKPQTQDNQLLRCNPLPPAITGFLLLLLAYICVPQSVAADQLSPFNSNALYSPSTTPVGPSLCPLVPACQCKWSNGKQGASCEKRQLSTIPSQLPPDTQILEMNNNSLNQLTQHIFQDRHLTNLQKIFLSDCKISIIADEAFAHLTNLVELDLSYNYIQQVPTKSLEKLSHSLRKLSLAHNPIQTIEPEAFVTLKQLNTLDLSNCHLSHLKPMAFHNLNQLKDLKLHDNRLTQLPMNALSDLREYLIVDLYGNPWHCDCELRQSIDWMSRHHIQQSIIPTCATPQRHKDIRWHNVKSEEFICPPVVMNKQNELIVGAGSNVSLACTARGTLPLTFVWFQDEKNLTTSRTNLTDPPASTKLLEEKRYEIAEELGPPGHPNITTSILYLFNLKLTDTSLFLCWVENAAGYTIANFSLVVNDSPPAHLTSANSGSSFLRSFGLSRSEAQVGIVTIGFVIILAGAVLILLMFRNSSRSSKSSQSSDRKPSKPTNRSAVGSISAANKFSVVGRAQNARVGGSDDDDDDDDDDTDDHSSSGSSCHKNPKMISVGDLDGFIEHMRSGIINMDYHSMSPVIQFNNTLKSNKNGNQQANQNQQQPLPYLDTSHPMHHFPSASNASSVPYYGNGSASMATTTSDLSPSSGSGNTNFATNGPITNCDLQHPLNEMAQATNTTTTSYTSDYQSGYSEDPANMLPPMYYESSERVMGNPYNQTHLMNAPFIVGQMRPPPLSGSHQQQQQLILQDMIRSRQMLPDQRLHMDPEFQIL